MEVIFPAPQILLLIAIGTIVIIVPAIFLKKGKLPIKLSIATLIIVGCGFFLFFFYRDTKFTVTEKGLYSNNYGEFSILWEEIDKAFIIQDLSQSEYNPKVRTNGYAKGNVGFGWFVLKNGEKARIVIQTRSQCLVVFSKGTLYLFGPQDFDSFIRIVKQHMSIETYTQLLGDKREV